MTVTVGPFAEGSYALSAKLQKEVEKLAKDIKKGPYTNVHLTGYTDNVFSPAFNATLTQERALAVEMQLETDLTTLKVHSVHFSISTTTGIAALSLNTTAPDRAKNRRVVVSLRAK